jgi:hypothetical protein
VGVVEADVEEVARRGAGGHRPRKKKLLRSLGRVGGYPNPSHITFIVHSLHLSMLGLLLLPLHSSASKSFSAGFLLLQQDVSMSSTILAFNGSQCPFLPSS